MFAVENFGKNGEGGFTNFSSESTRGVFEDGRFDELLSDGGTTFQTLTSESFVGSTEYTTNVESEVTIKVLVFDGDSGLIYIRRDVFEGDRDAVLLSVDLVKELPITVKNLGRDRSRGTSEFGGIGDVFEEISEGGK